MSAIADCLIDLHSICPEAGPQLAGIMQAQLEIDRLNAETVDRLQADHETEVKALRAEIAEYASQTVRWEIATALRGLCLRENLDPGPVIDGLASRCRFDGELTILDSFGCPTTFSEAVRSLREDD